MVESGHVDLQRVYTDGTKIESAANRYTFVWGKAIKASWERIVKQLDELWAYTQEIAEKEMQDNAPTRFQTIDPEEVRKAIEEIDLALKDSTASQKVKQKVRYAKKNWPDKLKQYEEQEQILGERNSFSNTDPDATFMRMKEDHMLNGQLKPGYNTQISTNQQIIVNYSIHQNPTDTKTLKPHLEAFEVLYGTMPDELVADAGYGSEENYEYLDQNQIEAFVKYGPFDKEQKRKRHTWEDAFYVDNLFYNKELDYYYCPMGQRMTFIGTTTEKTEADYPRKLSRYQAQNCQGCPLRGLDKVTVEFGLIAMAHNLKKLTLKGI